MSCVSVKTLLVPKLKLNTHPEAEAERIHVSNTCHHDDCDESKIFSLCKSGIVGDEKAKMNPVTSCEEQAARAA